VDLESTQYEQHVSLDRVDLELERVLAGEDYDSSIIDSQDASTRERIAAGLVAALSSRNSQQRGPALGALFDYGYFDEIIHELRDNPSPTVRATAARKLGSIRDPRGALHLIEALHDETAHVQCAAVESLGQLGEAPIGERETAADQARRRLVEEALRKAADEIESMKAAAESARLAHGGTQPELAPFVQQEQRIRDGIEALKRAEEEQRQRIEEQTKLRAESRFRTDVSAPDEYSDQTSGELGDINSGIPTSSEHELLEQLNSQIPNERASALSKAVDLQHHDAFYYIARAFDDYADEVRNAAARSLFLLNEDHTETFMRALREGSPERRVRIGNAIASSGLAREAIEDLTEPRDKAFHAFSLLFLMVKAGEVQPLMNAIEEDPSVEARLAVVRLLALCEEPKILPAFRQLAVRGALPSEVRAAVMKALYQISDHHSRELTPSAV
jgi:HEAT repeat protein